MLIDLKKRIERIETSINTQNDVPVEFIGDDIIFHRKIGLVRDVLYTPSISGAKFHNDNSFVRLIRGPYGSGKTTMCCMEIVKRAQKMPYCRDGTRKCRVAIIRNTYAQLETTTFNTWMDWCSELGETKATHGKVLKVNHRFNDGHGIVELEILFLALDRDSDIDRFKSLEVTFAYLEELSELPSQALMHLKGRVGRYPSLTMTNDEYWQGIISATNPPDNEHWIYKLFEEDQPADHKLFKQPSGLLEKEGKYYINEDADNLKNIPNKNYYMDLSNGATKEFIKVFCMGEYGLVRNGKPVYPNYNDDLHTIDYINVNVKEKLILGWDFGLTPACLICQVINDQLCVIKEFTTERMGITELISVILPYLKQNYPNTPIYSTCDPSGVKASEITSTTNAIIELGNAGLPTEPAYTNDITPRIDAVNHWLNKMSVGKPAFIVSKIGCPNLRKGFQNSYVYERLRVLNKEMYRDVPNKNHPFSDIHDCLQYICLYLNGQNIQNGRKLSARDILHQSSSMWV